MNRTKPNPSAFEALATTRLHLERVRQEHIPEWAKLFSDTRVMATLGGVRTLEQVQRSLEEALVHWETHGFGTWALYLRDPRSFVGRVALRRVSIDGRPEFALAYAVAADLWGVGLATEASRALIGLVFNRLALADLVAFTLPENVASRRVMEKLGFVIERFFVHANLPHVLCRLK